MQIISSQQLWILLPGLFCIAFVFSMFGRGGGEFILPLLISILSLSYFELATISLFLIFSQGLVMLIVYGGKHKLVDWPLALALSIIIGTFAFLGGYFSFHVKPIYLKGTFAAVLLISAYKIWQGKKVPAKKGRFGTWHRKLTDDEYDINFLYIVVPVAIIAGVAGMLGISGCGLIMPNCIQLGGGYHADRYRIKCDAGTHIFRNIFFGSPGPRTPPPLDLYYDVCRRHHCRCSDRVQDPC